MKYRIGACALLVGLAGCSADNPAAKFGANTDGAALQPLNGMALRAQPGRSVNNSIANAPDLGALVSYKNKSVPAKEEGAYTWYPVAVSEAHALKALMTGEMTVPAPDGSQVKLRYERHEEQADGNWTWIGRVEGGDQKQEAILTFGQDAMFGSIPQPNGAPPLSLQTRAGSLFAVVTDRSKVVSPNTRATDALVPPALALRASLAPSVQKAQARGAVAQAAVAAGAPATSANTIDLAIGYTPGFAAVYGGDSGATTRLVYLLTVGNQAYTNSQINGYLRLVKAVKVDYADNTDNEATLGQLTGHNGTSAVTVPAGLVPLRNARNEFGADLAVLVRKFRTTENNGCGIAWLNGAGQTAINPAVDDAFGYAVISDGSDSGTDGKTYFCAEETLVHELGHLMGSAHDRDNSKDKAGNLQYGRYPYSFGMKTTAANGNFYTIMAYGDNLQSFYRTFSNPLVLKCGAANNLACGIAEQADNARSLNQTIPVVASFRSTIVPFENALNLKVISKLGGSGTTEVHELNGSNSFASYVSNRATALYQTGSNSAWVFQFGDYNKDGVSDIYAINRIGSGGKTEVHVLNGATGYSNYLVNISTALFSTGSDSAWVFRLGDFNKDGVLDLYVIQRNGGSGRTEVHVLDGSKNFQSYLINVATALHSTGVADDWNFELGDHNKDGTLDVLAIKKNGTVSTEVHVLNGANYYQTFLINIATVLHRTGDDQAWVFKMGDYDGDGILDIFAINRMGASGRTEVHVLDGSENYQSYQAHIATALYQTGTDAAWAFELGK